MTAPRSPASPLLGNIQVDLNEADVTIDNATIEGGAVSILATADSQHLRAIPATSAIPWRASPGPRSSMPSCKRILGLGFVAGVSVSRSTAHISIDSSAATPTSIVADTFTAWATANVAPTAQPIAIKAAVAVAVGITDANVTIGNATITTAADATIRSSTNHAVNVLADEVDPKAGAVAVSVVVYNAVADVQPVAVLTVGGNLFVQADTTYARRNLARTVSGGEGSIGIAVAVDVAHGNTDAYLDGTAHVAGNVNVTAKETTDALTGNKAFVIPSYLLGVSALAGVGTNSTGDLLDDVRQSLITTGKGKASNFLQTTTKQPVKWLRRRFRASPPPTMPRPPPLPTRRSPISRSPERSRSWSTRTRPPRESATAPRPITRRSRPAARSASSRPSTASPSSAPAPRWTHRATRPPSREQTANGDTLYGVSLAVTVGLYENNADAHIAGNAIVDAGEHA